MSTNLQWALALAHCEEHCTACGNCEECAEAMEHLSEVLHEVGRQLKSNLFVCSAHVVHAWAVEAGIMSKREAA